MVKVYFLGLLGCAFNIAGFLVGQYSMWVIIVNFLGIFVGNLMIKKSKLGFCYKLIKLVVKFEELL